MARQALIEKVGAEHVETLAAALAFRGERDVVSIARVRITYDRGLLPFRRTHAFPQGDEVRQSQLVRFNAFVDACSRARGAAVGRFQQGRNLIALDLLARPDKFFPAHVSGQPHVLGLDEDRFPSHPVAGLPRVLRMTFEIA